MKNKKKIVIAAVALVLVGIVIAQAAISAHKKRLKAEQEAMEVKERYLLAYSSLMHIEGDFSIEGNRVVIENMTYEKNRLIEDVCLYNAFYSTYSGEPLSVDALMEEYERYCNNMESSELLERYRIEKNSIYHRCEPFMSWDRYPVRVDLYTYTHFGVDDLRASEEQVRIAAECVAAEIYHEVLELEREQKRQSD